AMTAHAGPGLPSYSSAGLADIPDEPPIVIGTGDFNRDGIADVVEATSPGGKDSGRHFLTILLGRGDGTFRRMTPHNLIGIDPRPLVVGDLNGDGNPDVIVGDGDGALQEFLGDGTGNVVDKGNIAALESVASIAIGQFTHDGHLDLVVSDFGSNSAII